MQFGYFSVLDNPGLEIPYNQILTELSEQTQAVEQAGFNGVWLGEHHFGGEGYDCIPNPLMILSHLAAQTTTIRLGLAAVIVPQWHPLRIAEDVAILDQLSGGRVECGVGRGIFPRELTNLNIDADRRNDREELASLHRNRRDHEKGLDRGPLHLGRGVLQASPIPASRTATPGIPETPDTAPRPAST